MAVTRPIRAAIGRASSHWAFRGAAIISAALAVEYATQCCRSVVLSHLLGPTEFGIGSAMVILWVLIDMSTGLGADRYLVQAGEGDSREALAAAHTVTLARNLLSSGLILALAVPTARLLGVPGAQTSFLWLAIIPVIRGFEHLRLAQLQRTNNFWPWAAAVGSTNIFGLALVTGAAFIFHDHRAVLWSLGGQAAALVVSTHVLSRCRYRLSVSRAFVSGALRFGLPLTLNGLALAAIGQADRLAVGHFLGVAQLGRYGLATMMFTLPISLFMRILTSTLAPRLSTAWHNSPHRDFPLLFRQISLAVGGCALLLSSTAALFGSSLMGLVFGHAYVIGDGFFAILSLFVLMKFAKTGLNFGSMAMGRTVVVMLSNVPSAIGLAATIVLMNWMPALTSAAFGALVGETLGVVAALMLMRQYFLDRAGGSWLPAFSLLPLPCLFATWCVSADPAMYLRVAAFCGVGVLVALVNFAAVRRKWHLQMAV